MRPASRAVAGGLRGPHCAGRENHPVRARRNPAGDACVRRAGSAACRYQSNLRALCRGGAISAAAAVDELVAQGVQVIVLGCTELPLLLRGPSLARADGVVVRLVDPTEVLAKRCVAYAMDASGAVSSGGERSACDGRFSVRVSAM
jgi:hypothetical protein